MLTHKACLPFCESEYLVNSILNICTHVCTDTAIYCVLAYLDVAAFTFLLYIYCLLIRCM